MQLTNYSFCLHFQTLDKTTLKWMSSYMWARIHKERNANTLEIVIF